MHMCVHLCVHACARTSVGECVHVCTQWNGLGRVRWCIQKFISHLKITLKSFLKVK